MTNINGVDEKGDALQYEIKIKGHLEEHWSDWLGGLEINHDENSDSLLTGVITDQAALHGILTQIRDLGLTLISMSSKDINSESIIGNDKNVERCIK